MPARVLREEILSSDSLSQVSTDAELVFMRLILVVDDFGRTDARVKLLRSRIFPMRPAFTEQKLARCLGELSGCEDPPIVFYEVDGHPYMYLPGWEKHRGKTKRAKKSRLPDPIQGIPGDPGDPGRSEDLHVGVGVGGGVGGGGGVGSTHPSDAAGTSPSAPLALEKDGGVWAEVNSAFRAYMLRSTGLTLTDARRRKLTTLVKSHGDDAPIAAIHGYAALHLTKLPDAGFDPLRNFNPETCWGGKIGKYIDADTAARDAGMSRPYKISNSETQFQDRVVRMTEDMKRSQTR